MARDFAVARRAVRFLAREAVPCDGAGRRAQRLNPETTDTGDVASDQFTITVAVTPHIDLVRVVSAPTHDANGDGKNDNYMPGDTVAFHRPYKRLGVGKGDELRVARVDHGARTVNLEGKDGRSVAWEPGRLAARAGGVEVYRSEEMELRAGDRIRWTRNDAGLGLVNSGAAEVAAVRDGRLTFRLEDGRTLDLAPGDPQLRHLDRAWASTVHAFQGRTVDTVIAAMEANRRHLTTQKSIYVEISRARDRAELVTDDKAALKEQLEAATGERIAALEAVGPASAKGREAGAATGRGARGRRIPVAGSGPRVGAGNGTFPHAEGARSRSRVVGCLFRRQRERFRGVEAAPGRRTILKRLLAPHIGCPRVAAARILKGSTGRAARWNGSMGTVLEDVTSEIIDAEHRRRRVDDWEERLSGLFAAVGGWLPDGWEARPGAPVVMDEELMRKFGVAAKRMPTVELRDRAGHVARLVPRGL